MTSDHDSHPLEPLERPSRTSSVADQSMQTPVSVIDSEDPERLRARQLLEQLKPSTLSDPYSPFVRPESDEERTARLNEELRQRIAASQSPSHDARRGVASLYPKPPIHELSEEEAKQEALRREKKLDQVLESRISEDRLLEGEDQARQLLKIKRKIDQHQDLLVDPSFRPAETLRQIARKFRKKPYGHMITSVIFMASQGQSTTDIAKYHKIPAKTVKEWLERPDVSEKVVALQSRNTTLSPQARLKTLVPQALDTIQKLMKRADKDSVRLSAAQTVLEYSLSKPKQEVAIETKSSLREVLEYLRAEEQAKFDRARDATVYTVKDSQHSEPDEPDPILPPKLGTQAWLKQMKSVDES